MSDDSSPAVSPTNSVEVAVHDHPERHRYELRLGADVASVAVYTIDQALMTISHVETQPELRGNDYAAQLMAGLLTDAAARGLTVESRCSYASSYMREHQRQPTVNQPI